jgi:hypothetical protein
MGEENHGEAGANRRRTAISPGEEDEGKSEGDDGVTVREEGLNFAARFYPFPPFCEVGRNQKKYGGGGEEEEEPSGLADFR